MKGINTRRVLHMVVVYYILNGENYVTAYKKADALDMLIKLTDEGAKIVKLEEFTC